MEVSYEKYLEDLKKLLETYQLKVDEKTRMYLLIGSLVIVLISLIAWWRIYKKAGKAGWKCLIPIVNGWTSFSIAGIPGLFSLFMIAGPALMGVGVNMVSKAQAASTDPSTGLYLVLIGLVLMILFSIAASAFYFLLSVQFGKGFMFGLFLTLFTSIGLLILAFGKAEYRPLHKKIDASFEE